MTESDQAAIERAITRVLLRYARSVDRRDYDGISACYWPDAIDDHGSFHGDAVAYVAWLRKVMPNVERSTHQFTNILIDVESPTRASSETYCLNVNVFAASGERAETQTSSHFRYLDRFEKRGGEWRISGRRLETDWYRVENPLATNPIQATRSPRAKD